MVRIIIMSALLLGINLVNAQTRLHVSDFKGIWKNAQDVRWFLIPIENKCLDMYYSQKRNSLDLSLIHFGFTKKDAKTYNLLKRGTMDDYLIIGGEYEIQSIGDNYMELYSQNLFWFDRINRLPQVVLRKLYQKCLTDSRDYILEFLDLDCRKVIIKQAKLYDNSQKPIQKTLPKGAIISIDMYGDSYTQISYQNEKDSIEQYTIATSDLSTKEIKPGFDCAKFDSPIENCICDHNQLSFLDWKLNILYQKKIKQKNKNQIKQTQRNWLKKRTKICQNKSGNELVQTLKKLYKKRLEELENM